jgi:NAD(P)-dependent dehydrogenase (short-subunit alcohol dehydrogenase family)
VKMGPAQRGRIFAMANPFDFTGKAVFVAGGSSGINLGIADAFAAAGAAVAIASRSQERIDGATAQLARHGGRVLGRSADVRDYATIAGALAAAHEAFGEIDVLVSGAAGNFPAAALGMSANAFKTVVDIDLLGTFNVLRAGHQYVRKPGASIINISAPQSYNPMPLQVHACAAKAGVDQVMRVLAMEWGGDGIRVNSIAPGPIEGTEGVRRLSGSAETRGAMAKRIPLGRLGTLEDVAALALFLASPLASFITGALIPVDGGWSLWGGGGSSMAAAPERGPA